MFEDEEIEFYEEDRRKKSKDEYYDDDPWEDYGEGYEGDYDDSDMS